MVSLHFIICLSILCTYFGELQHWTKVKKSGERPWPEVRCDHAACCLNYGQQHPQLLITGGYSNLKTLGDAWILDVDSGRWKKVGRKCSGTAHSIIDVGK